MKKCSVCLQRLSFDSFYVHPKSADGRMGKCKECHKRDVKSNRKANLEYYRQYDRNRSDEMHRVLARLDYASSERGKNADYGASKRWIERNREKRAAHNVLNNAVRNGRITKQPCELCFSAEKVQAHHDDYSKPPLEVRWFCIDCHALIHKDAREQERLARVWQRQKEISQ